MRFNNYVKSAILGAVCLCGVSPSAQAQWPTLDFSVITGEMQSIMQQVEQYKTQILESGTVGKINSAIGDAKSSMSKFKADTLDAAKKKAEKLKAQADKVKKVQEDIKKAKEEYEKKKKQFEDYKQKLEDAKKEVTDKIQEAKDTINEAKETVDAAKQAANNAVQSAKNQVNDVRSTVNAAREAAGAAVSQAQSAVADTQSQVSGIRNSVSSVQNKTVDNPLAEVQQAAQTQGVSAAVNTLNRTINEAAAKGDIVTLDAAANIDAADLVTSDSKVYDNTATPAYQGRQAFTPQAEQDEENAPALLQETPSVAQPVVESIDLRPTEEEEAPVDPMFQAAQQIVAPDPEAEEESESSEEENIKLPASSKTQEVIPQAFEKAKTIKNQTLGRQPFEVQGFLDDGEFARQSCVKIAQAETLRFADVAKECTSYNNSIQNGDDGKIIIMPESLAKYCCIEADKLTDFSLMQDCAVKMLKQMNNKDAEVQNDANSQYLSIVGEQNKNGLAEAIIDVNKATSYKPERMKPFLEKSANVKTTRDGISFITQSNIEMLYLMNQIRRIYTTAAVSDGIAGINGIKAEALIAGGKATMEELELEGEEPDAGIYTDSEYQATITRDDIQNYPIIPENMAKKCAIDVTKNINKVQDCYLQTVKNAHQKDNDDTKIGLMFIDSITFQETLNLLSKSLYQKVKSAQYDEKLEEVDESDQSATTVRQNAEAMSKTGYEITVSLDDIINAYASRLASKTLNMLPSLQPEPEKQANQKTEG